MSRQGRDAPDVLTDGAWCPDDRMTLRWVPSVDSPDFDPPGFEPRLLVACPSCHARIDQLCRTSTGRHRAPHASRLVPKRCGCGEVLGYNRKLCDVCRALARRENGRIGMRNTRARRRRTSKRVAA